MYPPIGPPSFYTPHPQPTDHQSSPPPADGMSINDFCMEYNLGVEVLDGLVALQFQIGDDHRVVDPEVLSKAGFARHHWARFCREYRNYKNACK